MWDMHRIGVIDRINNNRTNEESCGTVMFSRLGGNMFWRYHPTANRM